MKLDSIVSDGKTIITSLYDDYRCCGLDPCKYQIITKEMLYSPNTILNHPFRYRISDNWTREDAQKYLELLMKGIDSESTKTWVNVLDKSRYEPIFDSNFRTEFKCDMSKHISHRAIIGTGYKCSDCSDIVLGYRCSYCPISSGCPKCRAKSDGVCYMHQAEAIACLYYYNKFEIYRGYMPQSWIKELGGDDVEEMMFQMRKLDDIRYYISNGQNDTNVEIIINNNFIEINSFLESIDTSHEYDGFNHFSLITDMNVFDQIIRPGLYNIGVNERDIKISHITKKFYDMRHYRELVPEVNGFTYGIIENEYDIIDSCAQSPGSPFNAFTHAMLLYMMPYLLYKNNVLDLGCGRGTTLITAFKYAFPKKLVGIDNSKVCINDTNNMIDLNIPENYRSNFTIMEYDIFKYIEDSNEKFDVVLGNLTYSMQKEIIPIISKMLSPNGVYIAGGFNLLTEHKLITEVIELSDLEIFESKFLYTVEVIILRRKKDGSLYQTAGSSGN